MSRVGEGSRPVNELAIVRQMRIDRLVEQNAYLLERNAELWDELEATRAHGAKAVHDRDDAWRERDDTEAAISRVRELAEDAPMVPVHAGGGNLVNSKRMVSTDDLRAALNQGGETNGE